MNGSTLSFRSTTTLVVCTCTIETCQNKQDNWPHLFWWLFLNKLHNKAIHCLAFLINLLSWLMLGFQRGKKSTGCTKRGNLGRFSNLNWKNCKEIAGWSKFSGWADRFQVINSDWLVKRLPYVDSWMSGSRCSFGCASAVVRPLEVLEHMSHPKTTKEKPKITYFLGTLVVWRFRDESLCVWTFDNVLSSSSDLFQALH